MNIKGSFPLSESVDQNMMKQFSDDDFLLSGDTARTLYRSFAQTLPITDPFTGLCIRDIAENRRYANLTELWLTPDPQKQDAMRNCGIDEAFITGEASDFERFYAFASILPRLAGNPLYRRSQLELKRYFGCDQLLSAYTAEDIWHLTAEALTDTPLRARTLLAQGGTESVYAACDPAEPLTCFEALREESVETEVIPAFLPEGGLLCRERDYASRIAALGTAGGTEIGTLSDLKQVYLDRMNAFEACGCQTALHRLDGSFRFDRAATERDIDSIFRRAVRSGARSISEQEEAKLRTHMLLFFGKEYRRRGWVMQLFTGNSPAANAVFTRTLYSTAASIFPCRDFRTLFELFHALREMQALPKVVLYPDVSEISNAGIPDACLLASRFQGSDEWGLPTLRVSFTPGLCGMTPELFRHLAAHSPAGFLPCMPSAACTPLLGAFHEIFRLSVCRAIGSLADEGDFPLDWDVLGELASGICYENGKTLFGI